MQTDASAIPRKRLFSRLDGSNGDEEDATTDQPRKKQKRRVSEKYYPNDEAGLGIFSSGRKISRHGKSATD